MEYAERVAAMRRSYERGGLSEADLAPSWPEQFARWFGEAVQAGLTEPNAMVLATATPNGRPSARTVLLKGWDERGFVLFTNYRSRKGRELAANPQATLLFPWIDLQRQIVVDGTVEQVSREESAAYFASRPHGSQLGALASPQSAVIDGRAVLERELERLAARYPPGTAIPLPEHWGGLRVRPREVEFWQGRQDRLHDRLRFRATDTGAWVVERLAP